MVAIRNAWELVDETNRKKKNKCVCIICLGLLAVSSVYLQVWTASVVSRSVPFPIEDASQSHTLLSESPSINTRFSQRKDTPNILVFNSTRGVSARGTVSPSVRPFKRDDVQQRQVSKVDVEASPLQATTRSVGSSRNDCAAPDMALGVRCLASTTDAAAFTYPKDAREHALEVHRVLSSWTRKFPYLCAPASRKGRYCGPWIENYWMDHYNLTKVFANSSSSSCLSDTFGPYIPLLIPWVDIWFQGGYRPAYPPKFVRLLKSVLRSDVLYITISQNDEGLPLQHGLPPLPNVLVLSAGGVGHVPIPLLKQDEPLVKKKAAKRSTLVSYAGSLKNAPEGMRTRMHDCLLSRNNNSNNSSATLYYSHYYGRDQSRWRNLMADSYYSLTPRGAGRTSYHLMETLQRGYVPVHVYFDIPWIPYQALFLEKFGFVARVEDLPALLDSQSSHGNVAEREAQIARHRESHFSPEGVMHQIGLFMQGGKGDLECVNGLSITSANGAAAAARSNATTTLAC